MSKYGFNPDEVVTTKIDLIDKDGFHGVGEASDGGNSDGESVSSSGLQEGLYDLGKEISKEIILFILDLDNHEDFANGFYPIPGFTAGLYFGEKLDDDYFYVDGEMLNVQSIGDPVTFNPNTRVVKPAILNDRYCIWVEGFLQGEDTDSYPVPFYPLQHEGEVCHIVVPCEKYIPGQESITKVIQFDGVWHNNVPDKG